jgi:arylsulfatase A-like enzyme
MPRIGPPGPPGEPGGSSRPPTDSRQSTPTPPWQRAANAVAAVAVAAVFVRNVASLRFLGDDAFISFRYARNLAEGNGLVWNPGEAVEGYTNFLWVLMMAAGLRVGVEPETLSVVLGIASGVVVLALVLGRNVASMGWRQPLIWLAPAALVTSRTFTAWCSSGLETQFFGAVVLLALLVLCEEHRRGQRVPWIASTLFGVAGLIRPEGAIFMGAAGLCLGIDALRRRRSLWPCVAFAAPFAAIIGTHLLWRHSYYGFWLPNTFYAKVHGVWWEQGANFFGHFFADYQLHWFLPLAVVPVLVRRRFADTVWLTSIVTYAAYVFAVGGDRFEFRFLVVILPLAYMAIADGLFVLLRAWQRTSMRVAIAVASILLVAATWAGSIRPEATRARDAIASIGVINSYATRRTYEGRYLRKLIDRGVLPADLRVAVSGAGALPYYTMWPMLDTYGLNDVTIAHQPVQERTRIGHEQSVPPGYLAKKEIVVFDSSNRLVLGTDPARIRPRIRRAREIARAIRASDRGIGLETPARSKCLQISDNRVMVFVTVVPEPEFREALGHLAPCGEEIMGAAAPNVLLILVDTLRTDHVSAYGYERDTAPSLARLAAEGIRFDRAYAAASWTKPSVASIFTGQYPHRHGLNEMLAKLPEAAVTVAERMSRAGFRTAGVVSHNFVDARNGFRQGFAYYDSSEARGHSWESTEGVTRLAENLLEELHSDEAPFFLFVHYFDPHYEYRRHPEFAFAPGSEGRLRGGEDIHELRALGPELTSEEIAFLESVYDEEVRATDAGIGALLDALRSQGAEEDTLVIVAADHGEEFFERGWLGHTRTLYEEVIRVPLIVRSPDSEGAGRVVSEPVSLVSLAPTILDYAGIVAPENSFQAPSLRPLIDATGAVELPPIRSEVRFVSVRADDRQAEKTAFKYAVIDGRYKLIVDRVAKRSELYDLENDPGERENLADSHPELLGRMQALLEQTRGTVADAPVPQPRPGPDELEKLRKLGYIED